MPEKPRPPIIPRIDSGTMRAVDETGTIQSIRPPSEVSEIASVRITAEAALQQVTALTARVDGMTAGVDAQIQTSVKAAIKDEIAPLKAQLDDQDVATSELGENVTELLKLARDRQKRERSESLAAIKLTAEEQKVFSGKSSETRRNAKTIIYVLIGIAMLGGAAGLSHCKNAPKLELPE